MTKFTQKTPSKSMKNTVSKEAKRTNAKLAKDKYFMMKNHFGGFICSS